MSRINNLFQHKKHNVLNVFFTAGYPNLNDTILVLRHLQQAGVDLVEIGMPYSDPLADGPVIQESNTIAINNGMSIEVLFEQLEGVREEVSIPILLMGYYNPVIQYGVEKFIKKASELGIDGIIIPDLPLKEYENEYQHLFEQYNLSNVFLVTPQTSAARLQKIDSLTNGFIYVVSTNSTTGNAAKETGDNNEYFERIKNTPLKNPKLIGFNIKDNESFSKASKYAEGAIIGSAFIRLLERSGNFGADIKTFIDEVRGEKRTEKLEPNEPTLVEN